MGMTRRMQHYADLTWQPYLIVAAVGAVVILAGIVATLVQLVVSVRTRDKRRDRSGDPWDGRTLEWSTASPPPAYNFAVLPEVVSLDAFWHSKKTGQSPSMTFEMILTPRNSPTGFITAFFAVVTGFAMVWHITWMALAGLACGLITFVAFGWSDRGEEEISAAELAGAEDARRRGRESA
jgi:cytochrome o ubiquinol oxidase subunit 1